MKNTVTVKASKRIVKLSVLGRKSVIVVPFSVDKARGKVTYARAAKGSSTALKVNAKTGKVTVRQGTRKGTYKVKVKVTAAGNSNYKKASKTSPAPLS